MIESPLERADKISTGSSKLFQQKLPQKNYDIPNTRYNNLHEVFKAHNHSYFSGIPDSDFLSHYHRDTRTQSI